MGSNTSEKKIRPSFSNMLANALYDSKLLQEKWPKEILIGRIESIIEYAFRQHMKELTDCNSK